MEEPKKDVIIKTESSKFVHVTQEDLLNNHGVSPQQIAEVKSRYHFHKLSSVTLNHSTLICTFASDPDPSSIFYTPFEEGEAPVREFCIDEVLDGGDGVSSGDGRIEEKDIEIMPDGLAVRVGEKYISSEEIYLTPSAIKK